MSVTAPTTLSPAQAARQERLSLLAKADPAQLTALWAGTGLAPAHADLRPPEIGTVMVRGRAGAVGAAFNLGEMTVTRCTLRLDGGAVGHGTVQGRDKGAARIVALIDALFEAGEGAALEDGVLAPLRATAEARRETRARKAAATRVEFFTMVRGEG
ncbi:MAG: phosphonate C-P lyase system protein PhnG [Rhodobacteraceae bacterium]|nr:phosphonate C-P lyase system protein PhnG [Paracoccaceae bacterium]